MKGKANVLQMQTQSQNISIQNSTVFNDSQRIQMDLSKVTKKSTRQAVLKNQKPKGIPQFSSKTSSSMSENIEDDDEIENYTGPKKPNQEFSNSKIVTGAASTYIAQEIGQSPENNNSSNSKFKVLLNKSSNLIEINDKIRKFELDTSSTHNMIKHEGFSTNKNSTKSRPKYQIEEDRPLQMDSKGKRLTNNLKSNTFDSNQVGKMKRVRSQTSAKEYEVDQKNGGLFHQSNLLQQSLQFEFGVHKPTNKLSLGFNHLLSPHHQSTQCFMTTAHKTMKNHSESQHENIDNLYTLKKVQSKVRDKIVQWIDFQSTSATFNNNAPQEEQPTASNQIKQLNPQSHNISENKVKEEESNSDGLLKFSKLTQLAFKKRFQFGSPPDKMSLYNYPVVNNGSSQNINGGNYRSGNINNNNSKDFFNEDSLCITEENRFQNEINPIKLADLDWGDQYKLDKLMKQQIKQIREGKFDPNTYFYYDQEQIEEAFSWFEIQRKDMELYLMKRKSSAGLVHQNSIVNQSLIDFANANFKLQTSGTMLGLNNQRGISVIMGGGMDANEQENILQGGSSSSSDDEGGDEAEKFKNTFLNSKSGTKFMFQQGKRNSNLLIKASEQYDQEEDFNNLTPKVLSDNDDGSDNEKKKENRSLQQQTRGNLKILEELIEESREESMRGDSNTHFHIPITLDQENKGVEAKNFNLNINYNEDELQEIDQDQYTQGIYLPITNRQCDSDIFVMSNTTFDEDLASISSRRVSAGKQPYKNEYLSFVDNSQDLSQINQQFILNKKELDGITNKLFFHQQNQQLLQRRQNKYNQTSQGKQNAKSSSNQNSTLNINQASMNRKKSNTKQSNIRNQDKQLTSSIQTLLSQNNQTQVSTNIQSTIHEKKQSLTKFSNYVSSSNNLSPTPQIQTTSFHQYKNSQKQKSNFNNNNGNNNLFQSQYNSVSSINMGLHNKQPSTVQSNIFNMNSGHFSILSNNSNHNSNPSNIFNPVTNSNSKRFQNNGKSHSNEDFNRQVIAISTQLLPYNASIQKITHHSPQCSITMRTNLSPGPGYKVKERNSLFNEKTTRNNGINQHLSDSDISSSKFVVISHNHNKCHNKNNQNKRATNPSIQGATASKNKKYSDFKQSMMNNSTTIDSFKQNKQNMTMGSSELKQSLNAAKLRKQRSDSKMDTQSSLLFDGANSMVTQKLLASIKQNVINKKLQEQTLQSSQSVHDEFQQPLHQLNRQRSKSEIETIYEIGNKHQQLMLNKNKPSNKRTQQILGPASPSKSLKNVGFPYNNGKTMSDINKFYEERSEHNTSVYSVVNRGQNMSITSKFQNDGNQQYQSVDKSCKTFDITTQSQGSMAHLYNPRQQQSISGSGVLKEPSIIHHSKLEIQTNETSNSPQTKDQKRQRQLSNQQALKLNFGIQPQLVKKYQSPTAVLSQSYHLSGGFNQSGNSSTKRNESQLFNNSSIVNNSNPQSQNKQSTSQLNEKSKQQQFSVMKQRIVKSPNKKSMMILNSSIGSNSNNMSLIGAANAFAASKLDFQILEYSDSKK
ncbi:UNKNOWN [Stylonychia lemnae]|uniref:Uncharacterized protein n=1 Tax=Stylonychia lemnae TaxID=5949 RepID=A0A078B5F7_STYLE|nr:UNKNOWN [Stylonychia lemnae]|eukprot:CDW89659.1 UNKNOWN [Stylonychia lemnae]